MTERQINLAKHTIGLDSKKPYKRHGKLFYKPYRNYFTTYRECGDFLPWIGLMDMGYAEVHENHEIKLYIFKLTRKGMDALGQVLGMKIYDVR